MRMLMQWEGFQAMQDFFQLRDTVLIADDFPANLSLLETYFVDADLKVIKAILGL